MPCLFRPAVPDDLAAMLQLVTDAKAALRAAGVDQWQRGAPNAALLQQDIENGCAFLLEEAGRVVATAALCFEEEPSYAVLQSGAWQTAGPYATLHRIAVAQSGKGRGLAGQLLLQFEGMARGRGCISLRADTHQDNRPMRRLLEKSGFVLCGDMALVGGAEHGAHRLAYEKQL